MTPFTHPAEDRGGSAPDRAPVSGPGRPSASSTSVSVLAAVGNETSTVKSTRRPRPSRRLIAAAVVLAVPLAGCGASARTTSAAKPGSRNNPAASSGGAAPDRTGIRTSALSFSRCMRAHGVSNFPDPSAGGGFPVSGGLNPGAPAVAAAQAKCQRFMPGGGPLSPGPPASARTMALLRRIAVCMRQHGVPQFPDPKSSVPPGFKPNPAEYREITNYMGAILLYPAAIDPQSPAYEQATSACGAGFLAGNNAH